MRRRASAVSGKGQGGAASPLELWGGLECTVARIGEDYRDQLAETGHCDRADDLERIAGLGIRTLRYPALWESFAAGTTDDAYGRWLDGRLAEMRRLGIRPILGLVHHGSGPRHTNLLDPGFAAGLAQHAESIARRYPWVERYTPVNEPLTTARFSCLYGHWYPHARDLGPFIRAVANQCRGTLLAMRVIRRVNPAAKLVQTEDFGRVFSTPKLCYQADHENGRRWLGLDLLFGRVDSEHPWWGVLLENGVPEAELRDFLTGEGRPDIVGINHYLTSERFLDHRVERYPPHLVGGNAFEPYADVEAARIAVLEPELGPAARLREVWERYRAPIAVTEVHHGCTRDEQLRWLHQVWTGAEAIRAEGADIRAVTVWSMMGAVDWNTLLTRRTGIYEPGAFDIRGAAPRSTAIAHAAQALATTGRFDHPVLDVPGWWRRDGRFYADEVINSHPEDQAPRRAVLISGPDGPLRREFLRAAQWRGLVSVEIGSDPVPDDEAVLCALRSGAIWAVLDFSDAGDRRGREFAATLADACGRLGRQFTRLTLAGLFGPDDGRAFDETDQPAPAGSSARHARQLEERVLDECGDALVVRTGELFGPRDLDDVVGSVLSGLAQGRVVSAVAGRRCLTYLPDLSHVVLDLVIDRDSGIRHITSGTISLEGLVKALADMAGLAPVRYSESPRRASRPAPLRSVRGELMPPLESALDRYVAHCAFDWKAPVRAQPLAAE